MSSYKREKLKSLYESKDWSDCTFVFAEHSNGGVKIKAHKLILSLCSPVFERMLYGQMADDQILIEDIDAATFDKVLQYIYTECIAFDDTEDAWSVFYVSQKYFLVELRDRCLNYIKSHLSIGTLLSCYEHAALYDEKTLAAKCLDDIRTFCGAVLLVDQGQHHMHADTLHAILESSSSSSSSPVPVAISATSAALLTINWAMVECVRTRHHHHHHRSNKIDLDTVCALLEKNGIGVPPQRTDLGRVDPRFEKALLYARPDIDVVTLLDLYEQLVDRQLCHLSSSSNETHANRESLAHRMRYRLEYKNCSRLTVRRRRNEVLSPVLYATCDYFLFGVAVATKSRPPPSPAQHARGGARDEAAAGYVGYVGGANVYLYLRDNEREANLIYKHQNQRNFLGYDSVQNVFFGVPVLLRAYASYMLCIEYVADADDDSSVLLTYMSDQLFSLDHHGNHNNSCNISSNSKGGRGFCIRAEENGGVLKGLCFYEA